MRQITRLGMIFVLPISSMFITSCNRGKTFTVNIADPGETAIAFHSVDLPITHQDMTSHGYTYGDIITATCKAPDGTTVSYDLPYVTNYNEAGSFGPCLCDYESLGNPLQIAAGFKTKEIESCNNFKGGTCEIKMKQPEGFKKARDLARVTTKLTFEECGYENTKFANCRDVVNVGMISKKIAADALYRGSSPISESKNKGRYVCADNYLKYHQIQYDISLSLSDKQLENIINKETTVGPHFKEVYTKEKERIFTIDLGNDFCRTKNPGETKDQGGDMIRNMFKYITDSNLGSFFFHCNEGKDRTGFIVMIIEALCGVSLNDLIADYMLTFCNYYNITEVNNKEKYNAMANLTCYRNLYCFMIDAKDGNERYEKLANIDMLTFDSKKAVEELIEQHKNDENYLVNCAKKYMDNIGAHDYIESIIDKFEYKP